jgi:Family of unknown function (DUF6228)
MTTYLPQLRIRSCLWPVDGPALTLVRMRDGTRSPLLQIALLRAACGFGCALALRKRSIDDRPCDGAAARRSGDSPGSYPCRPPVRRCGTRNGRRSLPGRPADPYGDGYVHRVFVEVSDDGITASGWATFEGRTPQTLRDFLAGLDQDWRGWPGTRTWTAMENEMTLEAAHDGTGHVQIAVTLRQAQRAHAPDAWSARIVLTLEAGEQLREIASTADRFLRPPPP